MVFGAGIQMIALFFAGLCSLLKLPIFGYICLLIFTISTGVSSNA